MSIPVQELRIGNWLHGKDSGSNKDGYFQVVSIDDVGVNAWRVEGFNTEWAQGNPIPLTPEILKMAGIRGYDIYRDEGYGEQPFIYFRPGTGVHDYIIYTHCDDYGSVQYTTVKVQYVHQIQNVHFFLLGKELEFNFGDMKST